MDEAKILLDEIIQAITPPPNATLSQTFTAYNKAVEILHESLKNEYKKGYSDRDQKAIKEKISNQIKNN